MRNFPVHWHEGLFLRPQHFQAADRFWNELIATSEQWDHPYGYGLQAIEIGREALANHQLQIHVLKARMRDGTIVSFDTGNEPDSVNLKESLNTLQENTISLEEALGRESTIRVYVAIPKLRLGRMNVTRGGTGEPARFNECELSIQDESDGGDDQPLGFKALNARIMLSTQDLSGYEVLPILQIKRASEEQAVPRVDPDYIPPVISIDAWPGLGRDMVRAAYDVIGQKVEVLSQQIASRGIGLEGRDPGDMDRILMLGQLNEAFSTLGVLAVARGIHPLVAYTELARVAGRLALFSEQRRAEETIPYDHDDLGRIFRAVRIRLEQLINTVRDYEFEQRYLIGVGLGMQAALDAKWFHSDWEWFIGVDKGDLNETELRDLLSAGQLDWKFGSARQVEILFKNRAQGLQLSPLDRPVRALPSRRDWVFYEVQRNESPAWRDVQETQSLAMRLKDSLIVNRDRLQGERQLVVMARGKRVALQFALFAIPTR